MSENSIEERKEFDLKLAGCESKISKLTEQNSNMSMRLKEYQLNESRMHEEQAPSKNIKIELKMKDQLISELKQKIKQYRQKFENLEYENNLKNVIPKELSSSENNQVIEKYAVKVNELNTELKMKDKLIKFYMTNNPDLDVSNFVDVI